MLVGARKGKIYDGSTVKFVFEPVIETATFDPAFAELGFISVISCEMIKEK